MSPVPGHFRSRLNTEKIQWTATGVFVAAIAAVGFVMMTLTSSPLAKGAAFLWLPGALQLMAGVWLGPVKGTIAGGLGAYLAGILAYGGWGPVDIIMNPVAGGFANSFLPWLLFRILKINPTLGSPEDSAQVVMSAALRLLVILLLAIGIAVLGLVLQLGPWAYLPSLALVLLAPLFLRNLTLNPSDVIKGVVVCVLISAISALIGGYGQVFGGQTWAGALLGTSLGWFLGDTVSAILGLYMLAAFTPRAVAYGICSFPIPTPTLANQGDQSTKPAS